MAGNEDEAARIGHALVEERLAACVNILGPARSIYRWRDKIEDEREYLLVIKTRAGLYSKVERRVHELHSYEVPEVVALPMATASTPYLKWLLDSTVHVRRASAIR
jgi:periplasmic divalent cation tolerance protein